MPLKQILLRNLKGAHRVAVLGIGSELLADDVAGLLVAQELLKSGKKKTAGNRIKTAVFLGGSVPENLTGEIKRFKPSHVILIDAVDAKKKPGTIIVFDPRNQKTGVSFSSHRFPLSILADYLRASCGCAVIGVGIQPKRVVFSKQMSPEVERGIEKISRLLRKVAYAGL